MNATIARRAIASFALLAFSGLTHARPTIVLDAVSDNTLYDDGFGESSNGTGDSIFAGRTGIINNTIRRALIRFDLSSVPAGSTVTAATLKLTMLQTISGSYDVSPHRCLASWGEGSSGPSFPDEPEGGGFQAQPGDATWTNRFYPGTNWTTPGGDFVASPSATTSVDQIGDYNWSSSQLAADVQHWINTPGANHGWVVRGDEATTSSAKRFGSRTNPDPDARPTLTVTYTPPCPGDITGDGRVNTADLAVLLGGFGQSVTPGTGGDFNADGVINTADLTFLLARFGNIC